MQPKEIDIACVGYNVKADWYEGDNDVVLLVLPGFTSSKKNYQTMIEKILPSTKSSALVLDYSGHGESPFSIDDVTITENLSEVMRAYDWIAENYPGKKIDVVGTSYGGYFAAQLAVVRDLRKLVMRVPAIYDPKDVYTKWGNLEREKIRNVYRINPENFTDHPVLRAASSYEGQAYVLIHEFDEACPKASTDPYIASFNATTWEAKGFTHGFARSNVSNQQIDEYHAKLIEWLR